ncbi:Na+/Pi-cotransporter [Stieleria maiorica]|uniref:Na+/Pi-cotransporter n=1 Tax=Stieleria maiorica TaxID=2795974 RepID=A0A5B9MB65_9BACT|nr:hypothetical protein [Stieleria maiorica]QEF97769.1 Na+/Pi-cotransporter [Stieleria maiorica]
MVFDLARGPGKFLFGMKHLSDGMQAVAGNRLRRLINSVINNRIFVTVVGTIVTFIVQSSSITTVNEIAGAIGGSCWSVWGWCSLAWKS